MGRSLVILLLKILVTVLILAPAGCTPDPDLAEEPVQENGVEEPEPVDEEIETEDPEEETGYFWPWLSHGQLVLSSTEVVDGPYLFESDTGFVGEFTRDTEYSGQVVWLVDRTDVIELEWVTLTFEVDYYARHDWQMELVFMFEIEDLKPEMEDEGVQVFDVGLVEQQEGFQVKVDQVILGKEQEGSYTTDPIDFVALKVELAVVDKP